jgi:hypothetical protein
MQKKTPIEAAGHIYKIDELSALPDSSFQVTIHSISSFHI